LVLGVSLRGGSKGEMRPSILGTAFFQCIFLRTWLGFCPGETKFNPMQTLA